MRSLNSTARTTGLLYLLMSGLMIFGYLYVPSKFLVSGDAAATAGRIAAGELMYRASILTGLVAQILFVFVALGLYKLFKDVDRGQARLMAALVLIGVTADIVVLGFRMAPLVFLSGADFLSVFSKPQLDALSFGFLRWGGSLGRLVTSIWGLWLFPFGYLVIKSGFFPRILGMVLIAAGFSYIATCCTFILFPGRLDLVSRIVMPLQFGEVPIILWLLIMGAKEPLPESAHVV